MRHHLLVYPEDAEAVAQDYQYMFGPDVLAAPVVRKGRNKQSVYLPRGDAWYSLTKGLSYDSTDGRFTLASTEMLAGGTQMEVSAELNELPPMMVRAGAIVPAIDPSVDTLNSATNKTVVSYAEDRKDLLHLWVFADAAGMACHRMWDKSEFALVKESEARLDSKNTVRFDILDSNPRRNHIVQLLFSPLP